MGSVWAFQVIPALRLAARRPPSVGRYTVVSVATLLMILPWLDVGQLLLAEGEALGVEQIEGAGGGFAQGVAGKGSACVARVSIDQLPPVEMILERAAIIIQQRDEFRLQAGADRLELIDRGLEQGTLLVDRLFEDLLQRHRGLTRQGGCIQADFNGDVQDGFELFPAPDQG